jgi:hypothetical protein
MSKTKHQLNRFHKTFIQNRIKKLFQSRGIIDFIKMLVK